MAWHGSFKGKENNPSIDLEEISDDRPFFVMLPVVMQELLMTQHSESVSM